MKKVFANLYFKIIFFPIAAYTVVGFLLIPFAIQHYLPDIVHKTLGTHATLYKAHFNPYTFQVKLDHLVIQDKDFQRLASFNTLKVDFDVNNLLDGQLLFKRIYMKHLKLDVRVDDCGVYNFQHIIDHLATESSAVNAVDENSSSGEIIGIRISKLHIDDARVLFEDKALQEPFTVKTKPFDFELRDFSTVLNEEGKMHFMIATHETGSIQSTASISLQPFVIKGDFDVDDFNINKLYSYIKDNVDFQLEGNRLNAAFDYSVAYRDATLLVDILGSNIDVDRLQYSDANQSAGFKSLQSSINGVHLTKKEGSLLTNLDAFSFEVEDLNYSNSKGEVSHIEGLVSQLSAIDVSQIGDAPLAVALHDFTLDVTSAGYKDKGSTQADIAALKTGFKRTDLSIDKAFRGDIKQIHFIVNDTSFASSEMKAKLSALNQTLDTFSLTHKADGLQLHFNDFQTALDDLYYSDKRNVFTLNTLGLGLPKLDVDKDFNVTANLAILELKSIHLTNRKREILRMKGIDVSDVTVDTGSNEYNITKVSLNRANVSIRLYENLKTDFNYLVPETKGTGKKAKVSKQKVNKPKPQLNIKDIWLNNSKFTFKDLRKEPVVLTVKRINTHIKNATLNERSTIPFSFSYRMPQEGTVNGWGYVRVKPLNVKLNLKTKRIDLRPYMPYVKEFINLDMNSSYLNTKLDIRVRERKELEVSVKGGFSLQEIDLAHALTKERLFSVKDISVNELNFEKNHLKINEIIIDTPYNKIAIDENKSTNFDGLVVSSGDTKEEKLTKAPSDEERKDALTYMLGQLIVKNGTMDFSDFSLPLKFKTRVDDLEGDIVAISSSLDETMYIKLDGVVDEYGSAKIGGNLIAADPTKKTDIKVDFKNIDVTSLSPYTGKFIGRRIQSGKLWLDLGYNIDNKVLLSTNKIRMKDLELGAEIESEEASNMPVGLAIALLKDSDGYIDVSVPVEGNVDDPDFKYGAAAWKAVGNLIVGIAASPFKFLGSALGIDAEAMAKIEFDFGRAELLPPEKEKLDKLIDVFTQRPEIGLVLTSSYMLTYDKEALQREKFYALAVGEFKESDERSTKYSFVKKLYIQTFGNQKYDAEYDALKASLKEGDDFKHLFFDIQLEQLIATQAVTQKELEELANDRSHAIREHLVSKGFEDQRIKIKDKTDVLEESDANVFTMTLGIDVKQ
ncbi:MAG: DUF748 domain-containing protein [Sulfurimonadaceae bacterium]